MDAAPTILVVDDDPAIAELMRDFLEADGFRVEIAGDARAAQMLLETQPVDCLLLDVLLPGQSDFELCRWVRQQWDTPILFLSAYDADVNKIRGLGLGGDDYIVKSATPAEVVARVKAVLRRYRSGAAAPPALLDFGRLVIDMRAREVRLDSQPVLLTAREFDVLAFLAEHPRQVFTARSLYARHNPRLPTRTRGVTVYDMTSDQDSQPYIDVIRCDIRESAAVLDAALHHEAELPPKEHFTDTHGLYRDNVWPV